MARSQVLRKKSLPVNLKWLGTATVSPGGRFPVLTNGTWVVEYRVGSYGIDDGGVILMARSFADDSHVPQFTKPAEPGYVTVTTNGKARLEAHYQEKIWVRPRQRAIVITVRDGSLGPGDAIKITLGDTSGGGPGWRLQSFPEGSHKFFLLVDAFGMGEFYPLPAQPEIQIIPGSAAKSEIVLPSITATGQPVIGNVRISDSCGNPVTGPVGKVLIDCHRKVEGLPMTVLANDGVTAFGPITFHETGVYRLKVTAGDITGESNPIDVRADEANRYGLFWSDMHGQTEETGGTGTIEEYFRFARDRALIDITGWQGNDFQITDAIWNEVQGVTAAMNETGRFVTFLGYEWSGLTPAGGDHNIYYLGDRESIHRSSHWQIQDGSDTSTDRYPVSELWKEFREREDVLAIAHVGGRHANLDFATRRYPQLVEVHSHHGTFEWIAEEAVRRRLQIGFCGQSDDHTGRPGLSGPLQPMELDRVTFDTSGGYTGIYANELSREAVFQALQARHCFATTGRRIILDVRAGEAMMGDSIERQSGKRFELSVRVVAAGSRIFDVEVRRDSDIVYRYPWPADDSAEWIRIEWSGVRIRSRNKKTNWEGSIVAKGGTIEEFQPYAFNKPGQGVTRINKRELRVCSKTSGHIDGVLVRVSNQKVLLTFESKPITVTFKAGEVTSKPQIFAAGGVNQQVRISRIDPGSRRRKVGFSWSDPRTLAGLHAYWIKVMQADGHMAWSSPIFVCFKG